MNPKMIFLLLVAVACAAVAAVAGKQIAGEKPPQVVERPTVDIVVAAADIEVATKITGEKFRLEKWPENTLPQGVIRSLAEVEGKYTNQRMYVGEPLLERKMMNSTDSVATKIPEGYKVFDVPAGDANYLKPGDRVDVFGYFEKNSKITQTKSLKILENVTILMTDGIAVRDMEDTGRSNLKTIQLLIRDSQYEALTTAAALGRLRLALCGLRGGEESAMTTDGSEFMDWVANSVSEPSKGEVETPPAVTVLTAAPAPPAEPVEEPETFNMMIFSGGRMQHYRWQDGQPPQLFEEEAKPAAPTQTAQPAPLATYSGENLRWNGQEATLNATSLKSSDETADATTDATW